MSVFKRNLTSELIENACSDFVLNKKKSGCSLEIGCGDFNISRNLAQDHQGWLFCGSDISEEAIEQAKKYSSQVQFDLRVGSLFEPWGEKKFDLIISDVASISSEIAEISDWYSGVPCDTGLNGWKQFEKIVRSVSSYMNADAYFVVPYISLSDFELQKEMLETIFSRVDYRNQVDWPLPATLTKKLDELKEQKPNKNYFTKELFGMRVAFTGVAVAYNG